MINVTKPFLPPLEEYTQLLEGIWDRNWLTNNGPLVNNLEMKLKEYLGLDHILFLGNGTIAIQIAIKALGLKGEIITTPFSYVATTSSIVWENCQPVFVDIDENDLNINPELIEQAITEKTTGILATHVFGNPCQVEKIKKIADKYNLKVVYDAAHCFGTKFKGNSIFQYGDVSTFSFHATKIFHTIEGGAVTSKDENLIDAMSKLRNFGHNSFGKFDGVGINGKNSEYHAAMGLVNLKYIDEILQNRKKQYLHYAEKLNHPSLKQISINPNADFNYSYFPIIFDTEEKLLETVKSLGDHNIFPRRYFYPSLNKLDYVTKASECKNSESIASRILCLPLYHSLSEASIDLVCRVILKS